VVSETAGRVRLDLFVTPAFRPDPAAVVQEFRQVHSLLAGRFGEPKSGYVAVVQLRADPGDYWHFNSNQAVFAAGSPGFFSVKDKNPGANLAHENWTLLDQRIGAGRKLPAGRLGHLCGEPCLGSANTARHRKTLLETTRTQLFRSLRRQDGIWESGNQTNLNYDKGSGYSGCSRWRWKQGVPAGDDRLFQTLTCRAADWETLVDCFQKQNVPHFDASRFLLPWLKEKRAPRLSAQTQERTVTIVQSGPAFVLPVTLEGATSKWNGAASGLDSGSKTEVQFADVVSAVRIDPDEVLLLSR
jgi:hypothetical protein